jgi:acyl-CoA synthetase (AMP-forming)/AMP-acid ligase II/thioesterase domain-containing protein
LAQETPDALALLAPGRKPLAFSHLRAGIVSLARALQEAGITNGDIVAVAIPEGPELLTVLLGVSEVAAPAPLDCNLTEAEFHLRLSAMPVGCLLTCARANSRAVAAARRLGIPILEARFTTRGEVSLAPLQTPATHRNEKGAPADTALVLQTSATTGAPKVVPLTHANVYAICMDVTRGLQIGPADRYLSIMPLHHVIGYTFALAQLLRGGSVVCVPGFHPSQFAAWIEELRPTWYMAGPTVNRAILEVAKTHTREFRRSSLRFIRCGSAASTPALLDELERVLGVTVINGYGLTETGSVTHTQPGSPRKPGSVGQSSGATIGIMDESGNLLPPDAEGEVVMRGAPVMAGYLDNPIANREAFRNGWFRTGDLGRLDQDGDLFITGRIKEIINRGGETISPLEIDAALAEHPAIAQAASFGIPHPTLGEDVAAAVVLRTGMSASAPEIRSFLSGNLSRSKVPNRILFLDSIPLSAAGKPLRSKLSESFSETQRAPAAHNPSDPAPSSESHRWLQERIAAVWTRILHVIYPGHHESFFDLGGDSLTATRMLTAVEEELKVGERLWEQTDFFDSPTIVNLARIVMDCGYGECSAGSGGVSSKDFSTFVLQSRGEGPPVFFFPGAGLEPWYLRHLVAHLGDEQPFIVLCHTLTDADRFEEIVSQSVDLIRTMRPGGRRILAGHCYGGIVAFEAAQRLSAERDSETLVALLDVPTPGYPKIRLGRYLRQIPDAISALGRGQVLKLAKEIGTHAGFLRRMLNSRLNSKRKPAQPLASAGQEAANSWGDSITASVARTVLQTYVPRPFSGKVANFLARDNQVSARALEDPRLGWRDFVRGPLHEYRVAGQHDSMFAEQYALELSEHLRTFGRAESNLRTSL